MRRLPRLKVSYTKAASRGCMKISLVASIIGLRYTRRGGVSASVDIERSRRYHTLMRGKVCMQSEPSEALERMVWIIRSSHVMSHVRSQQDHPHHVHQHRAGDMGQGRARVHMRKRRFRAALLACSLASSTDSPSSYHNTHRPERWFKDTPGGNVASGVWGNVLNFMSFE